MMVLLEDHELRGIEYVRNYRKETDGSEDRPGARGACGPDVSG